MKPILTLSLISLLLVGCSLLDIKPRFVTVTATTAIKSTVAPVTPFVEVATIAITPTVTDTCREVIAETALNLRSEPNGAKLYQFWAGMKVDVTGPVVDGWQRIEPFDTMVGKKSGWVNAEYLGACQ